MSKIHAAPDEAVDVFAVVDLSGSLYLGGVFTGYADAKKAADQMGCPAEIVRYSIPVAENGEPCSECHDLIVRKYRTIATKDIESYHRQDY
jgi:hypothetical protein